VVLHYTISRLQRDKTEAEARADERARLIHEISQVIDSEAESRSPVSSVVTTTQTTSAPHQ
jgi:hypothetical protein